jgi:methionyl-tRNA formyltransferase
MALTLFFMGTGDFAVASLEALIREGHQVLLVVSQPDRPKGRGHRLQATPVKEAAQRLGLPVFQPERVKAPDAVERIRSLGADLGCVAAFGQILPESLLQVPRLGCVNVHASLLPRYRGAAPIAWALARGESETGVTIQKMVLRLDAGDILLQRSISIGPQDDTPALTERLARLGSEALVEAVRGLAQGTLSGRIQDEASATLAPLIRKEDGAVDFLLRTQEMERRCRAFRQWPGFFFGSAGEMLRLHALEAGAPAPGREPGSVLEVSEKGWRVACGAGESFWMTQVQPAGGKVMSAAAYARGHKVEVGTVFEGGAR